MSRTPYGVRDFDSAAAPIFAAGSGKKKRTAQNKQQNNTSFFENLVILSLFPVLSENIRILPRFDNAAHLTDFGVFVQEKIVFPIHFEHFDKANQTNIQVNATNIN